ncbi:MAG: glutamate synthase large subunit [Alphaproteobacteria bacterium]|nr:glutamate synthase large subunit [Alphaproteobacteria bacterium]
MTKLSVQDTRQRLSSQNAERQRLAEHGLYYPEFETDNCGVGLVATVDGKPRRAVIDGAIRALKAVWHRGAVDADGKTGDGAGIHFQIPQEFFKKHIRATGHEPGEGRLAVGMVFLPSNDLAAMEKCREIIEGEISDFGHRIYGWRQVPVDVSILGNVALASRPEIEQIILENARNVSDKHFEVDLFIIRRKIENALRKAGLSAYICSMSCRSIIYKGLFLAEQLSGFYLDLKDPLIESNFAIYHQRFSTNTFPSWHLAQPFRVLAHNGEINTLRGNLNWFQSHQERLKEPSLSPYMKDIIPVVQPGSSDSAALDAAFELMLRTKRELPEVKALLIPRAWENDPNLEQSHRDFYHYANSIVEPWDGPASICAHGGRWVLAGLDRHGLRPLRYALSNDGFLVIGSEIGMLPLPEDQIAEKGQLGPGESLAVNLSEGKLYRDMPINDLLAKLNSFGECLKNIKYVPELENTQQELAKERLLRTTYAGGWTQEDIELILQPMAETGVEATGSMGDDSPLAVFRQDYRGLQYFFRQNFAQVTNPALDPIRERSHMSLVTRICNIGNFLDEVEAQLNFVELKSPILINGQIKQILEEYTEDTHQILDCLFPADQDTPQLAATLAQLQVRAEEIVRRGKKILILTDENRSESQAAVPMTLAISAIHSHLQHHGLRSYCALIVRTSEGLDTHYAALLISFGATCLDFYLAQAQILDRHQQGLIGDISAAQALKNYQKALNDGILKIMSKSGISIVNSYRAGYNFEALGLSRALTRAYFPSLPSRISGLGLPEIEALILRRHQAAFGVAVPMIEVGHFYRYRAQGDAHAWDPIALRKLQAALRSRSYAEYQNYAQTLADLPAIALRDLLELHSPNTALSTEEVESVSNIRKRMVAPGISLGALSPIAHETLAIAMNKIGSRSDSGEGGEDPERFRIRSNGDNPISLIKQVASGRFGVTAEYLNNCAEIEIKIAQGAKPGEGGQLPGHKVSDIIAKLRNSTKGVTLISPPPHHDIYSIEDLAQLVYDLKQINPKARICVKLVARAGIGTIAAGVAKAKADTILISGHSGGTGASPQSSIKYAGMPWEMGLAEVHQVLSMNHLREQVVLRVDGGIKTGRDIIIAAILGAEEYGIGTAALIALGCLMVRQCHSNTCPVGICTQQPELIKKFSGKPDDVVTLFSFIAEEVRETLAWLGFTQLNQIIGRTDLLRQICSGSERFDGLDLNSLLLQVANNATYALNPPRNEVPSTLDEKILEDIGDALSTPSNLQLQYNVQNTDRSIGTRLSSEIVRRHGARKLQAGQIHITLRGTAGQSLGAFLAEGIRIEVMGDANDYVGKGLSGGVISVRHRGRSNLISYENSLIGNTVLYGATSGALYAAGRAGERFAVRNSGAHTVVEGIGCHGCEYMTGGVVTVLGRIGFNFGAGMTGGMAFLLDLEGRAIQMLNRETLAVFPLKHEHWQQVVRTEIEQFVAHTNSAWGQQILDEWATILPHFLHIVPEEIAARLEHLPEKSLPSPTLKKRA